MRAVNPILYSMASHGPHEPVDGIGHRKQADNSHDPAACHPQGWTIRAGARGACLYRVWRWSPSSKAISSGPGHARA